MKTVVAVLLILIVAVACGGGGSATPRATVSATAPPAQATSAPGSGGATSPEALCGLLTPADWQQFNYVTGASPDVTSDEPGTAICQFASGLFLEVYTHANETDAEATFQTILENVPVDEPQEVPLPGADETIIDPEIGNGQHAVIVVRKGPLVYTISTRSGDDAQTQLLALAGLVLARSGALQ